MKLRKIFLIFIMMLILLNSIGIKCCYGIEFNANSKSAILINSDTGTILYEKNINEKMYPASTTKIMTAILVLENCNLSDTVTVGVNPTNLPQNYISAHLQVGEKITVENLLYLLLLVSANDAAIALAEHVAGSVSEFSKMMNKKAIEIGCKNTNFVNPNGIHNTNHYSTAYDLALIGQYAMKNETFRKYVKCTSYTVPETNKYQERKLENTNVLLHKNVPKKDNEKNIYYYEYAIGAKTGYTENAGNCLVAVAKKDDLEYIVVLLGAKLNETDTSSERYSDAKNLLSTAIENYGIFKVEKNKDIIKNIEVSSGIISKKNLDITIENDIEILATKDIISKGIIPDITLKENLKAPIKKGDILGKATYTYDNKEYTQNVIAVNDVKSSKQIEVIGILGIIFVLMVLRKKRLKKKRYKRRYRR